MTQSEFDRVLKVTGVAVAAWGLLTAFAIPGQGAENPHLAWLNVFCGFSFLGFCGHALLTSPGRTTRVLAVVGLGCSLVFFRGPGIDSAFAGSVLGIIRSGMVLAGFAAMLHFLLLFPVPGPFVETPGKVRVIYFPAFLFWLILVYRAFFSGEPSNALNIVTYVFTGILMGGYLLVGLVVFLRRYIRTPRKERSPGGMRLMLFGSLAGFAPAAIGYMPALSGMPGNEYFFASLMVLPLVWSRAAAFVSVETRVEEE
jgi:hypothetical protein